ncbi:hypothetical protein FBU30_006951 [Linnemannia zychae]|nr:hypothetical protein FBU30_006951 [Linnemannia zychae]
MWVSNSYYSSFFAYTVCFVLLDEAPHSDFEIFLSQEKRLSPVLALQRNLIDDVMREWPNMKNRFEQLCPDGSHFDEVNSIRRGVLLDDDIADYVSKVILT